MYEWIFVNLEMYEKFVIFFGTLLLGDEVVYFLAFFAGMGVVNVVNVLIFGLIGNAGCDLFWFTVFKLRIFPRLISKISNKQDQENEKMIIKRGKRRTFVVLIMSKFFMGTRLATLFYVAVKRRMSYKSFFVQNIFAVFVWMIFVVSILFFIGSGVSVTFSEVQDVIWMINMTVFSVIILYLTNRFIVPVVVRKLLEAKDNKIFKLGFHNVFMGAKK